MSSLLAKSEALTLTYFVFLVARPRPASTAAPATPAASTNGEANATHRRRVITKPPVPKQTPLEKKPAAPHPPRTPRPINAPTPDLKNVRSKIGSIDNIKYQPGGGKVGEASTVCMSMNNSDHLCLLRQLKCSWWCSTDWFGVYVAFGYCVTKINAGECALKKYKLKWVTD